MFTLVQHYDDAAKYTMNTNSSVAVSLTIKTEGRFLSLKDNSCHETAVECGMTLSESSTEFLVNEDRINYTSGEVSLELKDNPGKYLCVDDNGNVEARDVELDPLEIRRRSTFTIDNHKDHVHFNRSNWVEVHLHIEDEKLQISDNYYYREFKIHIRIDGRLIKINVSCDFVPNVI